MEQLSLFDFEQSTANDVCEISFAPEIEEELKRTIARALVEFYTWEGEEHDDSTRA